MAKNKKTKKKVNRTQEELFDRLPQNIVRIGERVEEDKNIYILQSVYKEIHKFTKDKTSNEAGGILVGNIIEEFGKTNIIITAFIEGKYCEATPTTIKFTHKTWENWHSEIERKHKGKKIIGWIHTHPNFGIFLSEYDKFIHQNFFGEPYEVAYVIDPIQNIEGFYFWINDRIERCNGFYIFDANGKKIDAAENQMKEATEKSSVNNNSRLAFVVGVLCVAVFILMASLIVTNNKIDAMNEKFNEFVEMYNINMTKINNDLMYSERVLEELRPKETIENPNVEGEVENGE